MPPYLTVDALSGGEKKTERSQVAEGGGRKAGLGKEVRVVIVSPFWKPGKEGVALACGGDRHAARGGPSRAGELAPNGSLEMI